MSYNLSIIVFFYTHTSTSFTSPLQTIHDHGSTSFLLSSTTRSSTRKDTSSSMVSSPATLSETTNTLFSKFSSYSTVTNTGPQFTSTLLTATSTTTFDYSSTSIPISSLSNLSLPLEFWPLQKLVNLLISKQVGKPIKYLCRQSKCLLHS